MNPASFETYVEKILAPTPRPGQILAARPRTGGGARLTHDNLSSHKSPRAQNLLMAQGNWLPFLPPYSPDLNPPYGDCMQSPTGQRIEMAFAKLKTLIRKAAARTCQAQWKLVGEVRDLFPAMQCRNYFIAAGYGVS